MITVQEEAYGNAVSEGRLFIGSNAVTGLAIPLYSGKANGMLLINPAGSEIDIVLWKFYCGFYSTTGAAGNIAYFWVKNPGVPLSTEVTAFTDAVPINALLGAGLASRSRFAPAVCTVATTPTIIRTSGLNWLTLTVGASTTGWTMVDHIDRGIILPPNAGLMILGVTAVASVCNQSLVWEERVRAKAA